MATISKPIEDWIATPNLLDYDATKAAFSWDAVGNELSGLPGGAA